MDGVDVDERRRRIDTWLPAVPGRVGIGKRFAVHADKASIRSSAGRATKIRPLSTATAFQIIPSLSAATTSFGSACATEPNSARGSGDEKRFHGACSPNPSSTILPLARPLSISAWARLRLAALIAPKRSASVVLIVPASTSRATSLRMLVLRVHVGGLEQSSG